MGFSQVWLATELVAQAPWAHALRIAATAGIDLHVLHASVTGEVQWENLPTPRDLLVRWGFLPMVAQIKDFEELRFKVKMRGIQGREPARVLAEMLEAEAPGLVVLGSSRSTGLRRLFGGSVSEVIAHHAPYATLFVPEGVRPFVDLRDGHVSLQRILVPLGDESAQEGLRAALDLVDSLAVLRSEIVLMHVGANADIPQISLPDIEGVSYHFVNHARGSVQDLILRTAEAEGVSVIAMATRGHDSWWDSLAGCRAEQVMRHSNVPVLMARVPPVPGIQSKQASY